MSGGKPPDAPIASTRRELLATLGTAGAVSTAGCLDALEPGTTRVDREDEGFVIVARPFTEHRLISRMTAILLNETGTKDATIAPRRWESFKPYAYLPYEPLDMHWEYMGTANETIFLETDLLVDGVEAGLEEIQRLVLPEGIRILEPTEYVSSWELVVTEAWAEETGIRTYTDLTARYNEQQDVTVALNRPFAFRENAWPALLEFYVEEVRLDPFENVLLVPPEAPFDRLDSGDAQVAEGTTSAPQITDEHCILKDDENFYTASPVIPFVDTDQLTPELETQVADLAVAIDSAETIRELNARVDFGGEAVEDVAREFVEQTVL
jgi:glycine betaine/choline ABC-type transport system substrate-binding protein